ncbi:MAG TPA: guanylate kinase [Bellilinea sp.]|nr:guanylate kinase [Bellilinea sp.]
MCTHTTLLERNNLKPLVIVLSGPSGVGKDSVLKAMQSRGMAFHFVVTTTDRKPRKEEINGVDYNFISTELFEQMLHNDEFVEHARVYGDYKGVPKSQIQEALASGKDVVLRLDVQGAARVRELFPDSIQIFLIPENEDKWRQRFISRKSETEEMLQKRMEIAHEELKRVAEFNYVVINCTDCLDTTVNQIAAIIEAEHLKVRTGS